MLLQARSDDFAVRSVSGPRVRESLVKHDGAIKVKLLRLIWHAGATSREAHSDHKSAEPRAGHPRGDRVPAGVGTGAGAVHGARSAAKHLNGILAEATTNVGHRLSLNEQPVFKAANNIDITIAAECGCGVNPESCGAQNGTRCCHCLALEDVDLQRLVRAWIDLSPTDKRRITTIIREFTSHIGTQPVVTGNFIEDDCIAAS